MTKSTNPSIIMLDLRSSNEEIVIKAIEEAESAEEPEQFVSTLKKLSNNKNQQIKQKATETLTKLGIAVETTRDQQIKTKIDQMTDEEILDYFDKIITINDYEQFKPYLAKEGRKPAHIIADVREQIQVIASSKDPKEKVKAIFPVIFVPLEHKFKVNILLELLRDKSPYVIAQTMYYMDMVDSETLRKMVPVIISQLNNDHGLVVTSVLCFLKTLNESTFNEDIGNIQNDGLNQKSEKQLTSKLLTYLK